MPFSALLVAVGVGPVVRVGRDQTAQAPRCILMIVACWLPCKNLPAVALVVTGGVAVVSIAGIAFGSDLMFVLSEGRIPQVVEGAAGAAGVDAAAAAAAAAAVVVVVVVVVAAAAADAACTRTHSDGVVVGSPDIRLAAPNSSYFSSQPGFLMMAGSLAVASRREVPSDIPAGRLSSCACWAATPTPCVVGY